MEKDKATIKDFLLAHIEDTKKEKQIEELDNQRVDIITRLDELAKEIKALEKKEIEIEAELEELQADENTLKKRIKERQEELSNLYAQGFIDHEIIDEDDEDDLNAFVFTGDKLFKVYLDPTKADEYAVKELKVVNLSTSNPNV
jgi:predicted transcriptional regulator